MENYKPIEIFDPLIMEPWYVTNCTSEFKKDYRNWFMQYRWTRLYNLFNLIRITPGFENWEGNFTPKSLLALNDFIIKIVERIPIPKDVARSKALKFNPANWKERDYWVFTKRSFSIIFDVAVYFGEVFAIQNGLHWSSYRPSSTMDFHSGCMVTNYLDNNDFEVVISPITIIPLTINDMIYSYNDHKDIAQMYQLIDNEKLKSKRPTKTDDLPEETFSSTHPNYRIINLFDNHVNLGTLEGYNVRFKKKIYTWFLSHIETRTFQLNSIIKSTPSFESWVGGYTIKSLIELDKFIEFMFSGEDNRAEFSELQCSLIFDIGMYLGQVFVLHNCLHWEQFDPKSKDPDSGSMIIPYRKNSSDGLPYFLNPFKAVYKSAKAIMEMRETESLLDTYYHYVSLIDTSGMNLYGNPPKAIKLQ